MHMKNYHLTLLLNIFLTACASITIDDCKNSNWYDLGYKTGLSDIQAKPISEFKKECPQYNITINEVTFREGFDKGLLQYCTESHFYFEGEMGWPVKLENCANVNKENLSKAFDNGRVHLNTKNQVHYLGKRIETINNDKSFVADLGKVKQLFGGDSRDKPEQDELIRLKSKLVQLEKDAPDSKEYCEYEKKRIDLVKTILPSSLISLSDNFQNTLSGCSRLIR